MEELTERIDSLELEKDRLNFIVNGMQRHSKSQLSRIETDMAGMKLQLNRIEANIADMKADSIEIRNILATLVQKLG